MVRKSLMFVTKEEKDNMVLINTKLTCAEQVMKVMPPGMSEVEAVSYVKACIDSLSEYRWLELDWWNTIKAKYELPKDKNVNIYLDFDSGELYLED